MIKELLPHVSSIAAELLPESKPDRRGELWARCPFHKNGGEKHPSFSVNLKTGLASCKACEWSGDIIKLFADMNGIDNRAALKELKSRYLGNDTQRGPEAVYQYVDEKGALLFEVCRFPSKRFRQRRPDGEWKLDGVQRVPFRLPQVLASQEIILCEGEKDVLSCEKLGLTATTTLGGSNSWRDEYAQYFREKDVILIPDNDEAGRKYVLTAGKALLPVARSVRYLELPDIGPREDISDWLAVQSDLETASERLCIMIENAETFDPKKFEAPLPTAAAIVKDLRAQIEQNRERGFLGIDPGMDFLRKTIQAIIPTHLWIAGGYTSHGKSAFAVELIRRVRKTSPNTKITLCSLEMDKTSYVLRLASNLTRIPSLAILRGDHISEVQERIDSAFEEITQWNLIIFDDLYEWSKIQQKAREIKGNVGLDILVIDFLQNIWGKGSLYERMSQLAPQVQALAKELSCTILALSQVSNEAINEDLRSINYKGAGEIAAAADLGLWLERDRDDDSMLRVAIRKNRHGPLGKAVLRFKDNFTWLQEETNNTQRAVWIEAG